MSSCEVPVDRALKYIIYRRNAYFKMFILNYKICKCMLKYTNVCCCFLRLQIKQNCVCVCVCVCVCMHVFFVLLNFLKFVIVFGVTC